MKSIIWNLTRLCPWKCKFCCVSAKHVRNLEKVNVKKDINYSYQGELSFIEKKKVIDQLDKGDFRIDFSGGDLLIDPLNLEFILYASEKLGKENVGLSISGAFVNDELIAHIKDKVSDVEITLDNLPFKFYRARPVGYHEYAGNAIIKLRKENIRVGVETVITKDNMSKDIILNLYHWIEDNNVNRWSLLRFFQSGRGSNYPDIEPTYEQYSDIVEYIKEISKNGNVEICFQYLLPNHDSYTLKCRAVKKSIGILPNGLVTACFWALDQNMYPIDKKYELGKVPEMNIYDILNSEVAKYWTDSSHECELFTYEQLEKSRAY